MELETKAENPLVSIVVPLFNHEKYIKKTLESIKTDTYANKEIIVINDGSKDNSELEVLNWKEKNESIINIQYFYRENKGVCKTLNELITMSKGKYLILLASDDLLCNDTIKQRVAILEELEKNNKFVLICDAQCIDNNGNLIYQSSMTQYNKGLKENYYNDDNIINEVITNPSISGPVVLINKRIYDTIGLYRENLMAEDWYFYQRVAAQKALVFKDIICSKYRIHNANTSGINSNKSKKIALTCFLTYWYNWHYFPKIKHKYLALKQMAVWFLRYKLYK